MMFDIIIIAILTAGVVTLSVLIATIYYKISLIGNDIAYMCDILESLYPPDEEDE